MKVRITIITACFGIAYLFLISHLYDVQINKNKNYEAQAQSQQLATGALDPTRGSVYFLDKNNNQTPAILNKEFFLVYAVPKEIDDPQKVASSISQILGISSSEIEAKLNKPNKQKDEFESLKTKASQEEVDQLTNLNIKGIYAKKQLARYYPLGTVASHILGFVSPASSGDQSVKGRYGVESLFDDQLSGKSGTIKGDKVTAASDGQDIVLTIDRTIQVQAEDILKRTVEKWGATGGSIIVQEPKTGRILAMGSYPTFDPNNYSDSNVKNFLNPAVQSVFEPGSVFKPVTMSAGIDSGKITPNTRYNDAGSAVINGKKIQNWDHKAYGNVSMTNVIEHSLNLGTMFAERTMGNDIFSNYVSKFGFGEKSNIDLPGELRGSLNNIKLGAGNREVNFATASFGQGVSVTPLQMVNAISAIANGGSLMKPIILADEQPQEIRRVITQDTAKKVTDMMVSAVIVNKLADIPHYNIAGKTGTAYIAKSGGGGYDPNQLIHSYIGFAPAYDPKFIVFVKIDRPKADLAGATALPAFREMTEFLLNYYNIAPDK